MGKEEDGGEKGRQEGGGWEGDRLGHACRRKEAAVGGMNEEEGEKGGGVGAGEEEEKAMGAVGALGMEVGVREVGAGVMD